MMQFLLEWEGKGDPSLVLTWGCFGSSCYRRFISVSYIWYSSTFSGEFLENVNVFSLFIFVFILEPDSIHILVLVCLVFVCTLFSEESMKRLLRPDCRRVLQYIFHPRYGFQVFVSQSLPGGAKKSKHSILQYTLQYKCSENSRTPDWSFMLVKQQMSLNPM